MVHGLNICAFEGMYLIFHVAGNGGSVCLFKVKHVPYCLGF